MESSRFSLPEENRAMYQRRHSRIDAPTAECEISKPRLGCMRDDSQQELDREILKS